MKARWVVSLFLAVVCGLAPAAAAETIKYPADKNHSTVGFHAPILGFGKVSGKFMEFEITIVHDDRDISKSSVKVAIKTASVNTGIADRDAHLRTADFFDAEKYPEITFESTRVETVKNGTYVAHGTFRMRGVEKQIALPFRMRVQPPSSPDKTGSLGVVARMTINRREFGISWKHRDVPDFVGDEIEVDLAITTRLGRRD